MRRTRTGSENATRRGLQANERCTIIRVGKEVAKQNLAAFQPNVLPILGPRRESSAGLRNLVY